MHDPASPLLQPCQAPIRPEEAGVSPAAAEAMASIERTMLQVRRSIGRRELLHVMLQTLSIPMEAPQLDALGVIAQHHGAEADEVTVGLVAERLGLDPSRASRLVASVVERGLARRVASQSDARRICLELTERGVALSEEFKQRKRQYFIDALSRWDEQDLVTFARLFEKFGVWGQEAAAAMRAQAPAGQKED